MTGLVFNQAEFRHYNRVQAWLSIAILDFRSARRFLKRNKELLAVERADERIDCVS